MVHCKVDEKSNEITAIPELLKLLEIEGCLVSVDAIGSQTEIAQTIMEQGADYALAMIMRFPLLWKIRI